MTDNTILIINAGSSSLKFGLYGEQNGEEPLLFDGLADGIGRSGATITLKNAKGQIQRSEALQAATQHEALADAARWLAELTGTTPGAIGHRVVHGGPRLVTHQRITPNLIKELKDCVHFAPLHIPTALLLIDEAGRSYPDVPQFACFDTAFHSTIPEVASRFPLPASFFDDGIRRYGFHGLSYESIVRQLGDALPPRTVIAHLGSGASLAAVKDGRSVDTTMGLTPTGGIPMATRLGDIDPGVLLYLMRVKGMDADSLEVLLNHDSGLKALSGGTGDMRDLEKAASAGDAKAALAIEIFCLSIRKTVAAFAAALGGLDMLVFSGGIGEHSAQVRKRVCEGLWFLGVAFNEERNLRHTSTISSGDRQVCVRIVPSEEDLQIARHCRVLMRTQ